MQNSYYGFCGTFWKSAFGATKNKMLLIWIRGANGRKIHACTNHRDPLLFASDLLSNIIS